MRIYHGSIEVVERPEIRQSNRTLDYGSGFSPLRHSSRLRIGCGGE